MPDGTKNNPLQDGGHARRQTWNAEGYDRHARFVSDLGGDVLALLNPQKDERILDLGCGDGALTQKIVDSGAFVTGVDMSEELLDVARAKGLDVRKEDGQALTFAATFDAVFSNAALHWMQNPDAVLEGVKRAMKPGGRFVAEFGGHGNVAAIITAMRAAGKAHGGEMALAGPWFFPTVDEYRDRLQRSGFRISEIGLYPRPTLLPTDMGGWLQTFRKPFFDQFAGAEREQVLLDVVELLRPSLCDERGQWSADYARLRVKAELT